MATAAKFQGATGTVPASSAGSVAGYFDSATGRWTSVDENAKVTPYPYTLTNASVTSVAAGYSSDTYLAGSSITIPTAGDWTAKEQYSCVFDMTKTGAGTAQFTI